MTYADRIPLIRPADALRQARTAGIFAPDRPAPTDADRIEAERDDLRIQLGREQAETRNMVRDRDEVIRERDEARRACDDATADYWQGIVTTVCGERDEALGTISQAWAALNAAGLASPTASVAELIGQLTAERDEARRERDKLDAEGHQEVEDAARRRASTARNRRQGATSASSRWPTTSPPPSPAHRRQIGEHQQHELPLGGMLGRHRAGRGRSPPRPPVPPRTARRTSPPKSAPSTASGSSSLTAPPRRSTESTSPSPS
ncbi:hypothetical protein OOK41_00145 [Micromonospora sp. NBC_01655]|uniref:hypothetical protein n=1 Tax=Micromonospora sp. NBC_01655 TaxID=2975983 RepID=UPI00224F7083|nr:hypothetical protein [Micromonospora sp. NBC_01655]MCX4468741.1 hypothetical protein [Micromonospora sp. NBC_01655]